MPFFSRSPKIVTDEQKINELLTRGVENVIPSELAQKKLRSGEQLRVYLGIDPTGAKLHLGHSVPLRKLKQFTELGHHVVFLVGSFTAMVGDPTGRDTKREPITREQVEKNFETYKSQASKILDFSKVELRYNHEWLDKMTFADIMKLASHFTIQQMLERDMFRERMKWKVVCAVCGRQFDSPLQFKDEESFKSATLIGNKARCPHCGQMTAYGKETIIPPPNPISPNELLYPLMQGYDSVMLDVDCEVGGNDQLFNMLAGRKLQRVFGRREKFVLTTRLIEGTDGRKMSKTYDNAVYLEDSSGDMYGKIMSMRDEPVPTYFECLTEVPMEEVAEILKGHPKDAKMRLAEEIVALYHGAAAAQKAAAGFMKPDEAPEITITSGMKLRDLSLGVSTSELRRLIEQRAIDLDDRTLSNIDEELKPGVLKVGKHRFLRIKVRP